MTDEETRRFQKYVRRLQLADGIVTVLTREEREDMAVLQQNSCSLNPSVRSGAVKVLVISDDRMFTRDIHFCLKVCWPNLDMLSIGEGRKGIDMVEDDTPDLVIVGSSVPDIEMAELIIKIRDFSNVPLIVLAPEESEMDRVRYLEAGADDCVKVPFSPIELITRVKALLRRTWGVGFNLEEDQTFSVGGGLTINTGTREVVVADKPIRLTPIEYRILLELARNQGKVVSNEMILERVWGADYVDDVGFVKRYVYRLRQKLQASNNDDLLQSERGIGYRLVHCV